MTIMSKYVYRNSDNSDATGLTEMVGGQIGTVEYSRGNFDGSVFHGLEHRFGIDDEGYAHHIQ